MSSDRPSPKLLYNTRSFQVRCKRSENHSAEIITHYRYRQEDPHLVIFLVLVLVLALEQELAQGRGHAVDHWTPNNTNILGVKYYIK